MDFYRMLAENYDEIFPVSEGLLKIVDELTPASGRVADIGCASGALVNRLKQSGTDASGLEYVPELVKYPAGVSIGDMHSLPYSDEEFSTLLCTGNTLAHVQSIEAAEKVLSEFARVIKKGGHSVVQILNYEKILNEKPPRLPDIKTGSVLFERLYSYEDSRIRFTGVLNGVSEHVMLYPITRKELSLAAEKAGFSTSALYGGFDRSAFSTEKSFPLIAVFEKL